MKSNYLFLISLCICCGQPANVQQKEESKTPFQKVGGSCEGCEAIHESPIPFDQLNWQDTLADFNEAGPKLIINGVVYRKDGKTPAPDVVIYFYHTDQKGQYTRRGGEKGWGLRHGALRGWVKTNSQGQYRFYTLRPAPYPGSNIPAHIHMTIKEPRLNEYWIDEIEFADDRFLTREQRNRRENRAGGGIITTNTKNGVAYGQRNIYLGKNIPDYPKN